MNLDPIILAELQRGGPPLWVAGRTYPGGAMARSQANLQPYVRLATGAANADPSADPAGWMRADQGALDAIAAVNSAVGSASTAIGNARNEIAGVGAAVAAARTEIAGVSAAVQARGIKSVQRGVANIPNGPNSGSPKFVDVTIAAVNLAKTMCNKVATVTGLGSASSAAPFVNSLQLISPTVLRVTSSFREGGAWWGAGDSSWEVIEWN